MTTDEINRLPIGQKIRLMEALWDDLRECRRAFIASSIEIIIGS